MLQPADDLLDNWGLVLIKDKGPYSQRDFKPRLTKHDFNNFSIDDKIDMYLKTNLR